jgi:hypothetical protein
MGGREIHPEGVSTAGLIRTLAAEVAEGVTELACHPGYPGPDLASSYRAEREWELRAPCDPRVRRFLVEHEIALVGHADVFAKRCRALMSTVVVSACRIAGTPISAVTSGSTSSTRSVAQARVRRLLEQLPGDRPDFDAFEAASIFFRRMERYGLGGRAILYEITGSARDGRLRFRGASQSAAEAVFRRADLLLNFHCGIDPGVPGTLPADRTRRHRPGAAAVLDEPRPAACLAARSLPDHR